MTRRTDDDDALDENGLLKDGRSVRVSLMDAMTVRDHQSRLLVTDAQGGTSGLHRPGFRLAANTMRDGSHYEQRNAADAVAWQTGAGENESIGPKEGDLCNEPSSGSVDDHAMSDHYRAYDFAMANAWRTPR